MLSANILGLKVVGGKILDNGRIGALIEKVKKGSVADTVGHLRAGECPCVFVCLCWCVSVCVSVFV